MYKNKAEKNPLENSRGEKEFLLIIFCFDFEICFRMCTNGAEFRSSFANNDVSAVTAFPDCVAVF